ncbi:MAG: VOC family protein [Clostridia bacterium]|nr:VOC family protein [Clostridia bacterium]
MLLVGNVENREFLRELTEAVAAELPAPKKKKAKALENPPAVLGIHHISMKCGTPEEFTAAKAFYCGLLGMKLLREWPDGAMIDTGAGLIEIFCNGEGIREKGAIRHAALSVTDVDAIAARIRDAGYPVFIEPKNILIPSDPPLSARMAFCVGPLGEEIELFCEQEENRA